MERIADAIGRDIIDGRLPPGAYLNSVDLSRRFRTSRTPVREALILLSKQGVVDVAPQRRARVAVITLRELREIYQLRAALNSLVSKLIVDDASDEEIERLRDPLLRQSVAASRKDVDAYFWSNVDFRDTEMEICGNRHLKQFSENLRLRMHQLRRFSFSLPNRMEHHLRDHVRLLDAYVDRDAVLAVALTSAIVWGALKAVEESWEVLEAAQVAGSPPQP